MKRSTQEDPRWVLIRDAVVVQGKLIVDGLRDLALVPASLVAAFISLVSARDGVPGPQFYNLLRLGKRSERWINLFGAIQHADERPSSPKERDMDDLVNRFESYIVDEYRRGGVTAQAKQRLDKVLDAIQRGGKKGEQDGL